MAAKSLLTWDGILQAHVWVRSYSHDEAGYVTWGTVVGQEAAATPS